METILERTRREIEWFSAKSGNNISMQDYNCKVMTYEELYEKVRKIKGFSEEEMHRRMEEELSRGVDKREVPIAMIRYLLPSQYAAGEK